jgi:hypothetical protein
MFSELKHAQYIEYEDTKHDEGIIWMHYEGFSSSFFFLFFCFVF